MKRAFGIFLVISIVPVAHGQAGWFDRQAPNLAACEAEAVHRFKRTDGHEVRRHAHLCMGARGYLYDKSCGEAGWLSASCYRLRWKWEGR